jgi:hypothetical protein
MGCELWSAPEAGAQTLAGMLDGNLGRYVPAALAAALAADRAPAARIIVATGGGAVDALEFDGRALCSRHSPREEAMQWVAQQHYEDADVLFVLGAALGYHLEALRARTDLPMVVLEPSLAVLKALVAHRPLELGPLVFVNSPFEASAELSQYLAPGRRLSALAWPPTRRLFPEFSARTLEAAAAAVRSTEITSATLERRLSVWVEHAAQNLVQIVGCRPAASLRPWVARRPIVVVAAGPSLDANVRQLQRVGERAVVVAVNTAAGALDRAGVRADLIVAVEALDVSRQLEGLDLNRHVPRALSLSAHPRLFRDAGAPILPFCEAIGYFDELALAVGLSPCLPVGGSVAHAAFALARLLQTRQIILVGQDLAYAGDRVYAEGTGFEHVRAHVVGQTAMLDRLEAKQLIAASRPEIDSTLARETLQWVPGWHGAPVPTTAAFAFFREAFERWARATPDIELINATEGGARIEGMVQRRLAEVIDEMPPCGSPCAAIGGGITRESVLSALRQQHDGVERVRRSLRALGAQRRTSPTELQALRERLRQAGMLHGYCWSVLLHTVRDGVTDPQVLISALAERAARLSALLAETVALVEDP